VRYRFEDCSLDTSRLELTRGGTLVHIEPQVLRILVYLVEQRARVVTREELHRVAWGSKVVSYGALNVRVNTLRQALGDDGLRQRIIRTVPKRGYRFVADVLTTATPPSHTTAHADPEDQPKGKLEFSKPSIVILPLRNLGGPEFRVLAEGLTYDITTRLGRTRSMLVTARGTAFSFGDGEYDVYEVGRRLNVSYVCCGSIQVRARRLRVNVSVAYAPTREEIWAQVYDEKLDDFMLVQERVASQIVSAIHAEIDRVEQHRALLVPSENLDAWSAFHQGCWHMYRFRKDHVTHADRMFRRSIDLEPTVPRPYAGLSFIYFERAFLGLSRNRASDLQQAQELALRALELDPRDPMGHWSLSRAHLLSGDLSEAEAALSTAIDLNPSYATAIYSLGWIYMHQGRGEACIEQIENARRLSPLDPLLFAMLGVQSLNLSMMGRTREAVELAEMAIRQPNAHGRAYLFCALTHAMAGNWREASQLMERTWAEDPKFGIGEFFKDFPFQVDRDVDTISRIFRELEARHRQ